MWLSLGSDGSAACGGVKRPERVAAVGEGRRRFDKDIRRAPQQGERLLWQYRHEK